MSCSPSANMQPNGQIASALPSYVNPNPPFQFLSPYYPVMDDFCAADLEIRYAITRKFMEHTDKVCKMLLQTGLKDNLGRACFNGRFTIATKTPMYYNLPIVAGGWVDWYNSCYGNDIVSLYAYCCGCSYHKALHSLWSAFQHKKFLGADKTETKWHIQEKDPIAIDLPVYNGDGFHLYFNSQSSRHLYFNSHGRAIEEAVNFNLKDGTEAGIFYTIWRHHRGEELEVVPLFPEKPYMIYNEHFINENTKEIHFQSSEKLADLHQAQNNNQHTLIYSACPGGLENLLDADISNLYNKNIIINYDAKLYNFAFIDALKNKCEKEQSQLFINFPEAKFSEMGYEVEFDCTDRNLDATTILSKPERHGLKTPVIEIEYKKLSGFADVGEELPNAYRETRVLVEPIIESGSITWLFAAEKVGKTWLGLSIAYAAAKGHRPVGAWKVESPCRVLYIDGEMPAHKLTGIVESAVNRFSAKWLCNEYAQRPEMKPHFSRIAWQGHAIFSNPTWRFPPSA